MTTYGGSCNNLANLILVGNRTIICPNHTIGENGTITSWCIYVDTAGTFKLKIFRDDGTNYNFIGESDAIYLNAGTNSSLSANISVQSGDIISIQASAAESAKATYDDGSNNWVFKNEDVTGNSAKSSWTDFTGTQGIISLTVSLVSYNLDNVYVNSSTGNDLNAGDSCAANHPVSTLGKAYDKMNSGGTIYICNDGADFSSENITFTKPYNIAQGAAGVTNCKLSRFN